MSYATAVEISDVIMFSYDESGNSKLLNYSVETKDGSKTNEQKEMEYDKEQNSLKQAA